MSRMSRKGKNIFLNIIVKHTCYIIETNIKQCLSHQAAVFVGYFMSNFSNVAFRGINHLGSTELPGV